MKINKVQKALLTFLAVVFSSFVFMGSKCSALMSDSTLYKISILQGMEQCYSRHARATMTPADFSSFSSIFNFSGDKDDIYITTHVGNTQRNGGESDSNMKCSQILNGYNSSMSGFTKLYTAPSDLTSSGYVANSSGSNDSSSNGSAQAGSGEIVIKFKEIKDGSGKVTSRATPSGGITCTAEQWNYMTPGDFLTKPHDDMRYRYHQWKVTNCNGTMTLKVGNETVLSIRANNGTELVVDETKADSLSHGSGNLSGALTNFGAGAVGAGPISLETSYLNSNLPSQLKEDIKQSLYSYFESPTPVDGSWTSYNIRSTQAQTSISLEYKLKDGDAKKAAKAMLKKAVTDASSLPTTSTSDQLNVYWSAAAKYSLYYKYILDVQKSYPNVKIGTCSETKSTDATYNFKKSPNVWCTIEIPPGSNAALNLPYSVAKAQYLGSGTFKDVLTWLNTDSNYSSLQPEDYVSQTDDTTPPDPNDPSANGATDPDDTQQAEEDPCFGNSGALGWIVCPVVHTMANAAAAIYETAVEPLLKVDSNIFSDGTKQAWQMFRDLANIAFIIILLVIVFSQVTGAGIDNYGIKRMLPRLIIGAIIVNLSYLICQIAVDISNILGVELKNIFLDAAAGTGGRVEPAGFFADILILLIGGLGAAAAVGSAVSAVATGGVLGLILPILIVLLSALIAVIFFFIVMAVRQAGIIVLIVLSPAAMVCYMLPNTNGIFKKWFDAFKKLLVVFPIIGALVGAGIFTSKIMLSIDNNNFFFQLVAIFAMVGPYFFIPTLVTASLDGLGTIGRKIEGIGKTARTAADRRAKQAYNESSVGQRQMMQKKLNTERKQAGIANKKVKDFEDRMKNGETLSESEKQQYMYYKGLSNRARSYTGEDQFNSYRSAMEAADRKEQIDNHVSSIANGTFERAGGGQLDYNNLKEVGEELQAQAAAGNTEKSLALMQYLESKGDKGIEQVANAYDSGKMTDGATRQAIEERITGNSAYKKASRSLHTEAEKSLQSKGATYAAGNVANAIGSRENIAKMKAQDFAQFTDAEKREVFAAASDGDKHALQLLRDVQGSEHSASLNADETGRMNEILAAHPVTPASSGGGSGGGVQETETVVDHNHDDTPPRTGSAGDSYGAFDQMTQYYNEQEHGSGHEYSSNQEHGSGHEYSSNQEHGSGHEYSPNGRQHFNSQNNNHKGGRNEPDVKTNFDPGNADG